MKRNVALMLCKSIEGEPLEIQVIPAGFHQTPKGDFVCDEESASLVIEEFDRQVNDMVVDYEHQTLMGVEAPAAGWIKKLINKGKDGIWAVVEWTDRAKAYIANKEYRYVSPVFLKRASDNKVVKLVNVALTNQPNIDGMIPLINKAEYHNTEKEVVPMKNLFKLLGLPEDATEEAVIAAVNKLKTDQKLSVVANKAVTDTLGLKEGAGESEVIGTIMAMKQGATQLTDLSQKVVQLENKLKGKDADELVGVAMKDGKITADQKEWATDYAKRDLEGFKVFVAKAPQVVPMGGPASKGGDRKEGGIDEAQLQVNKMLGISEEAFKKHNPDK